MIGLILAGMAAAGWADYTNVKYGYFSCYPSRIMRAHGEPAAGDGQFATARDGGEWRVWGHYAPDGTPSRNLASEAESLKADLAGRRGVITYSITRPGWTVFSGRNDKTIFWVKVMTRDDRVATIQLTYPIAQAAKYQSIPSTLNSCSKMGTAPF
ncbi:hypothetical protein [Sphingomonas paucimobilis]|uniref:hypothetical protein n=1 Tax=Sphingomonas paucimobilis TaxID=13689 RepID=UPI00137919B2|nr:hypothetical protein [Sphingomonas paucimobilis]